MTFHLLSRDPAGEHHAMTVHEKKTAKDAMQAVESSGMIAVSIEADYDAAKSKARQLNAANGVVSAGCSSC